MFKKTKIVATISDLHCEVKFIKSLYTSGLNVVRLNTAHMDREGAFRIVKNVREVSNRIAILIDTKGPEVRTTKASEEIRVSHGDRIMIRGNKNGITTKKCVYVNYPNFVRDVSVGSRILIDDGSIELLVKEKSGNTLECEALNNGVIEGRKSVNIPSVDVKLPALSEKDIDFIHFAIENELDFIAHSFVRNKKDVLAVQKILNTHKSKIQIIAKIENQEGVDHVDEILDLAYGVMVARGDLAVEIPQERIPGIQKMLIEKCISKRKPVIIATQMLHSMIQNPRPTRAEISDVANAIYDGTDAIMLSGETAYGNYPVESVKTMAQIALEVESIKPPIKKTSKLVINNEISAFFAINAVNASIELATKAIVADTLEGRSIRALAAYRGKNLIIAQCYSSRSMRELALSYGVYSNFVEGIDHRDKFIIEALRILEKKFKFSNTDRIVVIAGNYGNGKGLSYMEIATIEEFKNINTNK
jgi:pyruvate kinase